MNLPSVGTLLESLHAQGDLMRATSEELNAASARVCDGERTIVVEVNAAGALTGLSLGRNAYRDGPSALANAILEASGCAAKIVAERQYRLASELTRRLSDLQIRDAAGRGVGCEGDRTD
jgi:hypothetical protein